MIILKRVDLIRTLQDWQSNTIDAVKIFDWANEAYLNNQYAYEDWEGDNSVSNEIMAHLDNLNISLVTKDDIPAMLEFLDTPPGQFDVGYKKWIQYVDSIDIRRRQKELGDLPFYKPFC